MFVQSFLTSIATALVAFGQVVVGGEDGVSFPNPVLPGWHSDPSCINHEGTFFCVISTFIAFPGLPIYASKDLINWKLASHAWSREAQLPGISWQPIESQQKGMYAATIRHHDGHFYVICEYLGTPGGDIGVIFNSTDPFDDDSWSMPAKFKPKHIDPDLFWDDDGQAWVATHGVHIYTMDVTTGEQGPEINIWNGTGGVWPEGPHIYQRDGWYYLMIAEGGTEENHSVTIARAKNITGPYESYENNPILTNRGTKEFIQNVGHADLFQDTAGNWWGLCLGVRNRTDNTQPMGRESFLFNVTWNEGEWPVLEPVSGKMPADLLPPRNLEVQGKGPFVQDPDNYDFTAANNGTKMPGHFMYWRVPREDTIFLGKNALELVPSRNNLTGIPFGPEIELTGERGLSFVGRRQTHTLFTFGVDVAFDASEKDYEAGITVFRTQLDHIDLGIVNLNKNNTVSRAFRFRAINAVGPAKIPETQIVQVPSLWQNSTIRLEISTPNGGRYELSAMPVDNPGAKMLIGTASAEIVSGGNGTFVGSLVGVYATCNGQGSGLNCPNTSTSRFTHWKYDGVAQQVDHDEYVFQW